MTVEQIMNRHIKVCGPQESLNRAAQIMWEVPCGAVPVVNEQSRPIGFLTDRDICMAAYTQGKPLAELRVEGAMAQRVISCKADEDLRAAARTMRDSHVRRLLVVNQEGQLAGLLTLDDIASETARTLTGEVSGRSLRGSPNEELRNLVLEIHLAIHHGRAFVHEPA